MEPSKATTQTNNTVTELLQAIDALVTEVHPHRASTETINLDSSFEKDLGLDSLARVELISRVEKQFKLALPERTFAEAESARDLLRAIQGSKTSRTTLHTADIRPVELGDDRTTPDDSRTLIDVLNWHIGIHPNRPHIQIYTDEGNGEVITYRQLKNAATRVAGGLQKYGLKPAEPVALMLPSCAEYFYSFYGILIAGGIPVPLYPPARPSQLEDHMRRHVRILTNCLAKTFITVPEAKKFARLLKSQVPNLQHIVSATELTSSTAISTPPVLTTNDIAFIQYTSGSTGNPKGVVLTHANLLTNIRAMGHVVNASPKDIFVSWLPLYHDMGLIGAWLGSLYYAALFVVMSPLSFLARPERWLWAIHHYHGTLSASPNFGYEYCLRHLNDEDIKGLDLSSWRAAFNGAESVSPETLNNFSQRFESFGFNKKVMMPVYGLAESTVGLAFPPLDRGPVIDTIERYTFMQTGIARPTNVEDEHALKFVSSGPPLPNHQIRVIDPAGHELPERHEGRLEFTGPSSTTGYYRDTKKTQSLFDGEWLDTGDLAYIANGELFVTGRIKDIIIRAGRNIYPHELEEAVGNIPDIRTGRVAVFGSEDRHTKTERLIIMAETRSKDNNKLENLRTEINTLATDLIGSPPDEVVLAPPGTVLKTSSGKIRRAASRELFEKGVIGKNQPGVYWQIVRITFSSILPEIRRMWRYSKTFMYAIYCWLTYCLLTPPVWLATVFLPSFHLRWSIMKNCTRLLGKMTATQVKVNGLENIPANGQPYVLVSNHASYIDSYSLVIILPGYPRFIAKKELARFFFSRIPLKHINTEFVDRFETSKGIEDTRRLANILKAGNTLIFFAEGTFTRIPGLRPFHLGAFTVAAEAEVPIIPIAIRGTRSILRSEEWFPHHGSINIEIGEAIDPKLIADKLEKDTWAVAIELRNRSREFILRHCGEPDLAQESTQLIE
jgi:acyl carrier protein